MAAGGANIGLKDMEPLQVCKYLHDEAEVEQLSDISHRSYEAFFRQIHNIWCGCVKVSGLFFVEYGAAWFLRDEHEQGERFETVSNWGRSQCKPRCVDRRNFV